MPWYQWWSNSDEAASLDGVARWNNYVDDSTGELILPLPNFMTNRLPINTRDDRFKAGPYAFT